MTMMKNPHQGGYVNGSTCSFRKRYIVTRDHHDSVKHANAMRRPVSECRSNAVRMWDTPLLRSAMGAGRINIRK